jgi:sulfur carrier protein
MTIQVNGEPRNFEQPTMTLPELLVLARVESPELVTVQINGEFVDRSDFSATSLRENDEVDFLYYLGGGLGG